MIGREDNLPKAMIRTAAVITLVLFVLFAAANGLARARPPGENAFLALIRASETCATICPLDIAVGSMSLSQAVAALERSGWVNAVRVTRGMELDSGYVQWAWSGAQPEYIDPTRQGSIWFQQGIIQRVEIATRIPFGELWQHTSTPQTGRLHSMAITPARAYQTVTFAGGAFTSRTEILCPLSFGAYWFAPVVIRVNSPFSAAIALRMEPDPYEAPRVGGCG